MQWNNFKFLENLKGSRKISFNFSPFYKFIDVFFTIRFRGVKLRSTFVAWTSNERYKYKLIESKWAYYTNSVTEYTKFSFAWMYRVVYNEKNNNHRSLWMDGLFYYLKNIYIYILPQIRSFFKLLFIELTRNHGLISLVHSIQYCYEIKVTRISFTTRGFA